MFHAHALGSKSGAPYNGREEKQRIGLPTFHNGFTKILFKW